MNELTPEQQITKHYSACMDSVNLIDSIIALKPEDMTLEEATDTVTRNVQHLEIMVAKGYWHGDELAVLTASIAKGKYEPINVEEE
jgi:hypothetical protein